VACTPGQVLFNASIRDNIAYGVDVSDEEVIQALKDAKIWDFVEKEPDRLLAVRLMISHDDQNRRCHE
jgi:ABC-type multidrug transport system fused ATPase/permease subunit